MSYLTTKVQIIIAFVIMVCATIIISYVGSVGLTQSNTNFIRYENVSNLAIAAEKFGRQFDLSMSFVNAYLLDHSEPTIDVALTQVGNSITTVDEAFKIEGIDTQPLSEAKRALSQLKQHQETLKRNISSLNLLYNNEFHSTYQNFMAQLKVLSNQVAENQNIQLSEEVNHVWEYLVDYYGDITRYFHIGQKKEDGDEVIVSINKIEEILQKLPSLAALEQESAEINKLIALLEKLDKTTHSLVDLGLDRIAIKAEISKVSGLIGTQIVPKSVGDTQSEITRISQRIIGEAKDTTSNLFLISAIIICFAIGLALFILMRLTKTLKELAEFSTAIAVGDFTYKSTITEGGEIGVLTQELNRIPVVLNSILDSYATLSEQITLGSILYRINAKEFTGSYAQLVEATNNILQRFTIILDNIPSPVVILDKELTVSYLNTVAISLTTPNYQNYKCVQLFAREDDGTPTDGLQNAKKLKKPCSGETIAHPNGKALNVQYTAIPLLDEKGNVASFLQLVTDITALKEQQNTIFKVAEEAINIANQVATTAEEISLQINEVNRGAEVQRTRVESTASAMVEMNATVSEVARSAADAANQSDSTRAKAEEGANMVHNIVQSMESVNKSSTSLLTNMEDLGKQAESIGGVMNVISDIADQTNLLALNAAIEAARAGEAGRGFAVVADEVRKLAEKTMQATQEVGDNIVNVQNSARTNIDEVNKSAKSIEKATELVNNSGTALAEIVDLATANFDLVASIATASEEQSATSEEINSSIEEINAIVAKTSEDMKKATDGVRDLSEISQKLRNTIDSLR